MASCSTFAWQAANGDIRTVEGLAGANGELDPVQAAFIKHSSFQCGYCTPGMIMLARALLDDNSSPVRNEIREWMGANICRCTGYEMIIDAVEDAAKGERVISDEGDVTDTDRRWRRSTPHRRGSKNDRSCRLHGRCQFPRYVARKLSLIHISEPTRPY